MNDLLANAAIQQLNLGYDAEQDRLLLKVGLSDDSEISAWLTRRVVKSLWALLQQAGLSATASVEVLQAPAAEDSADGAASEQVAPYHYSEAYHPRAHSRLAQPMLAQDCHLHSGDSKTTLELKARSGAVLNIALSGELTQALGHMLLLATREAAWDIGFTTSRIIMKETGARPVLH